jgi:hypothetical protein
VYYLSYARLDQIQKNILAHAEDKKAFQARVKQFHIQARQQKDAAREQAEQLGELIKAYESQSLDDQQRTAIYDKMQQLAPENRHILGNMAFFHAQKGEWQKSLDAITVFLSHPSRETSLSLSLGLLKGQVLMILGHRKDARQFLIEFSKETQAAWYKIIVNYLTGKKDLNQIIRLAGSSPEKLITLYTALGLEAEAENEKNKAAFHYREALSSYLDDWNEYHLALGRMKALRTTKENSL